MAGMSAQRKLFHLAAPIAQICGFGEEFKIANVLADGAMKLVAEDEPAEGKAFPLPVFRERLEADILGEEQASEGGAAGKQGVVREFDSAIFLRREHIHTQTTEMGGDGRRNVNVELKRSHASDPLRAAMRRRRNDEAGARSVSSSPASSAASSASISS